MSTACISCCCRLFFSKNTFYLPAEWVKRKSLQALLLQRYILPTRRMGEKKNWPFEILTDEVHTGCMQVVAL
jgi:hypothetical protein